MLAFSRIRMTEERRVTSAGEFECTCLTICADCLELYDSFKEFVAPIVNFERLKIHLNDPKLNRMLIW